MSSNPFGDLASWALRGVGGADNEGGEDQEEQGQQMSTDTLTPEEMRAQRLARMDALQKQQSQASSDSNAAAANDSSSVQEPKPMDIDDSSKNKAATTPKKMEIDEDDKNNASNNNKKNESMKTSPAPEKEHKKKKAKESHISPADPAKKTQKKAELLIKKVLSVSLAGTSTTSDSSCVVIDIDDTAITVQTVAEILATRLALSPNSPELRTMPPQKALIPYLAQCHRRAAEEIKTMKQSSKIKTPELLEILEEIKRQVVSYAASSLNVPELFELGHDSTMQLAKCFTSNVTDLASSITFGVAGTTSSFYYLLCDELVSSDEDAFGRVISEIVEYLTKQLSRMETVLEGGDGADGCALVMVSALTAVCVHRKAAEVVTQLDSFLLPPEGSPQAQEVVENRPQANADLMARLLGIGNRSYLRRSGPGLDRGTVLGLCLRPGIPKSNPVFGSIRMSLDSVERTTSAQRQQLRVHQEACNQLVMALIKAGSDARAKVCCGCSMP